MIVGHSDRAQGIILKRKETRSAQLAPVDLSEVLAAKIQKHA